MYIYIAIWLTTESTYDRSVRNSPSRKYVIIKENDSLKAFAQYILAVIYVLIKLDESLGAVAQ